ncbi:MAG: hypothetical protein Kow0090_00430 [Myxococcota bacterium]
MTEETVEVTILGKTYHLTSDGDTELLKRAANLLNFKISEVSESSAASSSQTAVVLAALNLAEEYLKAVAASKERYDEIKSKIVTLVSQIEKQVDERKKIK